MVLIMKIQNLHQKNCILLIVNQKVIIHTKILLTKSIESSLFEYSDPYVLVTGNITATASNAMTQVVFKNCAPFKDYRADV